MDDVVIRCENLGKKYRLGARPGGHSTYRRFSDALVTAVRAPFAARPAAEEFWALQEVALEIRRGEVVGLIGRNGAGKSTLLKLLSQVTEPTTGRIEIEGRLASLLEVGTGFHPELSGRDNVFLNGAILGMTRREIRWRFDEIVAFAEVERFIDTPVKRYSSGMYVRLAFAVAAHLEPDILVVDEVLAVGDAAFQRKCLGKMNEIAATGGRTVLFVSHQLGTVSALCNRAVLLDAGKVARAGPTGEVVARYVAAFRQVSSHHRAFAPDPAKPAGLRDATVEARGPDGQPGLFSVTDEIRVTIRYAVHRDSRGMNLALCLLRNGSPLLLTFDTDTAPALAGVRAPGEYTATVTLPPLLKAGHYTLHLDIGFTGVGVIDRREDALAFDLEELNVDFSQKSYAASRVGEIACNLPWKTDPPPV